MENVLDNLPAFQNKSSANATAAQLNGELCSADTSRFSNPTTVVPWATPSSRTQTPHSNRGNGPLVASSAERTAGVNRYAYQSNLLLDEELDKRVIKNNYTQAAASDESLDMDSGPPTPNTDDTPYIRFAIDQLTRDEEVRKLHRPGTGSSTDSYPAERIIPNVVLRYPAPTQPQLEAARQNQNTSENTKLFNFNATAPLSPPSSNGSGSNQASNEDLRHKPKFIPVEPKFNTARYHDLAFIPTILRPLSMIMLALMTLLMTAGLMFCAIYSTRHSGLLAWYAGIYGGRYFLFGMLPQILAAILFFWIQCVLSAVRRITPFMMMAGSRPNAIFQTLYPSSLFAPPWQGPLILGICNTFFWLSVFTIPLQSSLFSVIYVQGVWRWTAVQAVAWTLTAIYILIFVATVTVGTIFFRSCTGLRWDPRSLADIMALLPRSNCLEDFTGTDTLGRKEDIKHRLGSRKDRLGYWHTSNSSLSVFYCMGKEQYSSHRHTGDATRWRKNFPVTGGLRQSLHSFNEKDDIYDSTIRSRHIPWYLQDSYVVLWAVTGTVLLIAILVVSFLPSTAIRNGFSPQVPAGPDSAGFSPGNFLYSFVPSLLGQILFLAFQTFDMAMRKLQPWAELGKRDGSPAERSLLLDYHASFNFQCFLNAIRAGHYRVAFLSLLSFIFILLPILGGGFLFPLTTPANTVRMIPNLPSFYILISLLILYLIGLLVLIPNRRQMYLPHGADCLAEIIGFMYGSRILDDATFRSLRSRADMVMRLSAAKPTKVQYIFGVHQGRHGQKWLGIDRVARKSVSDMIVMRNEQWV
ncbi:hypothetical protein F5884DRAFT_483147 [Xylogone sp. PMI_703]|nr:hypothetical protein F5884DRAFT_483147 [Xylogone sp. PMI_703]